MGRPPVSLVRLSVPPRSGAVGTRSPRRHPAGSAHVRVPVVGRRDEQLLDVAGADPADQVEDRAGLVVGAAGPGTAEGLLPDDRPGRLVVDVEIAGAEAQRVRR